MGDLYAGLDVSDKQTHICIVDGDGSVFWSGRAASDPEALASALRRRAGGLVRVVLETGPLSAFLYHGLLERGVAVTCICARHAKGVLSARGNKSDAKDAEGLAQLARCGWYRAVHIKETQTHLDRAGLRVRAQLVKAHRDLLNQLRGLLKLFGLRLGSATTPGRRQERLRALLSGEARLASVLAPLLASLEAIEASLGRADKDLKRRTQADPVCRRLMTAPGVGPVTAATFKASIEDAHRFKRLRDAGAYAGLVPRRHQSGQLDLAGGISKRGDGLLRQTLYEAANSILGRLKKPCALRRWGLALQARKGAKLARTAVARKLAELLLKLWREETDFNWAV